MYYKKKLPTADTGLMVERRNMFQGKVPLDELHSTRSQAAGMQFTPPTIGSMHTERTFGEDFNWGNIYASNMVQGLGQAVGNMLPNSYQNAVLRYNQEKYNPTNYLPHTPNNSVQDLYGMKDGGLVGDDDMLDFLFSQEEAQVNPQPIQQKPTQAPTQEAYDPSEDMLMQDIISYKAPRKQHMQDTDAKPQLDPNVVAAAQELQSMFPKLKITSTIRNWGDKDAHPKGRAIDLAGEDTDAAWKYYSETLVPKYGFNKALDPNHGTGKHIHVGYYEGGGETPVPNSKVAEATAFAKDFARRKGHINAEDTHVGNTLPTVVYNGKEVPYGSELPMNKVTYRPVPSNITEYELDAVNNKAYYRDKNDDLVEFNPKDIYLPQFARPAMDYIASKDKGGKIKEYKQGGSYELSDQEIKSLLDQGYELEET